MIAFGFLDVEANALDALLDVELEHLARRRHTGGGQHRDHVKIHSVLAQQPDAGDGLVEGAASRSSAAVEIMKVPRAIDADAEIDMLLAEEFAPFLVDQRAVCLKRMSDQQAFRLQPI